MAIRRAHTSPKIASGAPRKIRTERHENRRTGTVRSATSPCIEERGAGNRRIEVVQGNGTRRRPTAVSRPQVSDPSAESRTEVRDGTPVPGGSTHHCSHQFARRGAARACRRRAPLRQSIHPTVQRAVRLVQSGMATSCMDIGSENRGDSRFRAVRRGLRSSDREVTRYDTQIPASMPRPGRRDRGGIAPAHFDWRRVNGLRTGSRSRSPRRRSRRARYVCTPTIGGSQC